MAHTQGPWKVESFGSPRVLATGAKGDFPVCDIRGWGYLTGKGHGAIGLPHAEAAVIQDANARLIAAAPDLLGALERILPRAIATSNDNLRECRRQLMHIEALARAAIACAAPTPADATP